MKELLKTLIPVAGTFYSWKTLIPYFGINHLPLIKRTYVVGFYMVYHSLVCSAIGVGAMEGIHYLTL